MKFTTTEDYATLLESINIIENVSMPPKKTLTESDSSKNTFFEAIGKTPVEVKLPKFKNLDLTSMKSALGRK